ncbi:MAG: hypothetical protein QF489_01620 [Planctomycetota bacterium]|jgi:hypothetical protein|nr:hypothetical protein [Planctomycetota bacterium]
MKRIGVALMAAAPLWAACSDSEVDWDSITALEGANGAQAALEWRNGLDFTSELQYPITVHWDIDIQLKDIPQPLGPAKDGFIVASLDTTLFGKNEFRTRCSIEMAAWGRDEFIIVHLDSNHEELRISHRGIDSIGPIEVPTGMVISADRLQLATDFLLRLVSNAPGFLAEELKVVSDFDGISDIFHPDNIARLLGPTTLQQGCTWRQSDERTQVTFAPLMALASSEATEVMPSDFSLSGFDQLFDLEITMEFDRVSGAFMAWILPSITFSMTCLPTPRSSLR